MRTMAELREERDAYLRGRIAELEAERDRAEEALDRARGFIGRFMAGQDVRVEAAAFCASLDEVEP